MTQTPLPSEVQALVDRQAIMDCLNSYCRGVDRADRALLLSAYHEDAQDDHGVFCGSANAFADWAFDYHSKYQTGHHHYILNHSCELKGDTAHTETYYLFSGINREGPPVLSGGRYIDRFEKRNGRWAIADRKCLIEWQAFLTDVTCDPVHLTALRSSGHATRDRTDTSYERPLKVTSAHRTFPY
ncbi:MAG: nuclear transport factor 2 family protein [Rhodospirillaceae bacterium]|nr:MAG: nuclear transport factor 2 family protein [Rhodospirillaceae bacterium]